MRTGSLAALVALALAGCGSSSTKTVTVTTAASTASATTRPSTATTTTTSATTASNVSNLTTFKSPSGNIGCIIVDGGARCDIMHRSWSPPPRPSDCGPVVAFGQGLAVNPTGAGRFVCAGDTTLDPRAAPLAYGADARVGSIRCSSSRDGMTCTNETNSHGFFISFASYRIF